MAGVSMPALLGVLLASLVFLPANCLRQKIDHLSMDRAQGKRLDIKMKRTENLQQKSKLMADLLLHQTQLLSPFISFTETKTEATSVNLLDVRSYKSTQYLGEVGIGENQWFQFVFDTGSAQIFVNSDKCKDQNCLTKRKYSSSRSKTYKSLHKTISVAFGSGIIEGELSQDTVSLGNMMIDGVVFAEIVKPSKTLFHNAYFDGVLGLALPGLAREDTTPIFDRIMESKELTQNSFSFFFDRIGNFSKSFFSMGAPDKRFYKKGSLVYHPVLGNKYWEVRLNKVFVGDKETDLCVHGCTAIFDTGSSLISGPSESVYKLLANINADPHCKNFAQLPTISFQLGDTKYTLKPKDYMLASRKEGQHQQATLDAMEHCLPGLAALSLPRPHETAWVFGDLFLSKYFVTFDRDHNRVGLGTPPIGTSLEERVKVLSKVKTRAKSLAQEETHNYSD